MTDQFKIHITPELAKKLVSVQLPEYSHLHVVDVEKQGHDNLTYRLGEQILIRMPSAERYAKIWIYTLTLLQRNIINSVLDYQLRTDSNDSIYPFYTLEQDFYDAPLWKHGVFFKPLSFWKGHAWEEDWKIFETKLHGYYYKP